MFFSEEWPSFCEDALHAVIRMKPDPPQRLGLHIISIAFGSKAAGPDPNTGVRVRKQITGVRVFFSSVEFPDGIIELASEVEGKNFDLLSQLQR